MWVECSGLYPRKVHCRMWTENADAYYQRPKARSRVKSISSWADCLASDGTKTRASQSLPIIYSTGAGSLLSKGIICREACSCCSSSQPPSNNPPARTRRSGCFCFAVDVRDGQDLHKELLPTTFRPLTVANRKVVNATLQREIHATHEVLEARES